MGQAGKIGDFFVKTNKKSPREVRQEDFNHCDQRQTSYNSQNPMLPSDEKRAKYIFSQFGLTINALRNNREQDTASAATQELRSPLETQNSSSLSLSYRHAFNDDASVKIHRSGNKFTTKIIEENKVF